MLKRVAEFIPLVCLKQVRLTEIQSTLYAYIVVDPNQLPTPAPAHSDIPEYIL